MREFLSRLAKAIPRAGSSSTLIEGWVDEVSSRDDEPTPTIGAR